MSASTSHADRTTLLQNLLKGGGVTLLVGVIMLLGARIFPPFAIPGAVCTVVGLGLLLAGCVVFLFSRPSGREGRD